MPRNKYDKYRNKVLREPRKTDLNEYSFLKEKNFYENFLIGRFPHEEVIENRSDFWMFVKKYEATLKNSGLNILPDPLENPDKTTINDEYRKILYTCISVDFSNGIEKLLSSQDEETAKYRVLQFREIVLLYLDFKQKEKFQKLRKLRKLQKSLPIFSYKNEIVEKVRDHQVLILAGDTGCGKSTQLPQYLRQIGYRNIACTQPRRLACVSLSKRVAHEMLEDYGTKIGYQIRFERNRTANTEICFITEGLLLRQLALDPSLLNYDVLILDEVHERNLHGDILLGVTKCLLRAQPNLKLILMSATINLELFRKFFHEENSSFIEVPGRLYPIRLLYMPPPALELKNKNTRQTSVRINPEQYVQILSLIDQKYPKTEKGDVLMFLSGVNEINTVIDGLKQYNEPIKSWIILPLHSGLSLEEQDKVFGYVPEGMRKCVVSTNIAETSLTIDGIRFVVDSGKMKEMSYDSSSKMRLLKEFWVSKSSAEQRKGRAGRTGPGICYRLYSQKDFDSLIDYPTPEIRRVPLESILLQMVAMGLPDVRLFPFIEPPPTENIEHAILILKQQDALTYNEKITPLGRALSALPVEITIGKMLLMGCVFEELPRILTFSAGLSIQTPFTTRAFTDLRCERAREEYISDQGDPFTLINIYREWLKLKLDPKENTKKWSRSIGIEEQRFYEITKLRNQFQRILETSNIYDSNKEENKKNMTSTERSIRHGELRMLKAMKRTQKLEAPAKRKILKLDLYDNDDNADEDGKNYQAFEDIRDVDFRLSNDTRQLKSLIEAATVRKHKDVTLMKIIIVSGLYPNIAIPDEFNTNVAEHLHFYHTLSKSFVSLHPNSDFTKNTERLKLTESDLVEKPLYYSSRLPLSSAHQILCYQSILETTKPYLLNTIRMPAAQTLLLFASVIDTDILVTRIVCDSWLSLEFPFPGAGQEILIRAVKLRRTWRNLLERKLDNPEEASDEKEYFDLSVNLMNFFSLNINYTIKRLLLADLKTLYNHQRLNPEEYDPNPFANDFKIEVNEEKGGLNVSENLIYGCLIPPNWSYGLEEIANNQTWTCNMCEKEISLSGLSRLTHSSMCKKIKKEQNSKEDANNPKESTVSSSKRRDNLIKYNCDKCNRTLYLSKIDILKHKKRCTDKECNKTDSTAPAKDEV